MIHYLLQLILVYGMVWSSFFNIWISNWLVEGFVLKGWVSGGNLAQQVKCWPCKPEDPNAIFQAYRGRRKSHSQNSPSGHQYICCAMQACMCVHVYTHTHTVNTSYYSTWSSDKHSLVPTLHNKPWETCHLGQICQLISGTPVIKLTESI